jgi:hypothetical protein
MDQRHQRELAKLEITGTALRVWGRLFKFLSTWPRVSIVSNYPWQSSQNGV